MTSETGRNLEKTVQLSYRYLLTSQVKTEDPMKHIEVVAAIICRGKSFFATQRGYGEFEGWWEFPGGKVEAGETREEALLREIREELSADIAIDKYLTALEWDYPKFHLILHCFLCSPITGSMHLNEHEAARWLDKETAGSVRWLPADEQIIPLIIKELEQQ